MQSGAGVAATGGATFGGSGTSIRNSVPPTLWTTGSPLAVSVTTPKILCLPAGLSFSVFTLKISSVVSLVMVSGAETVLFGRACSTTVAWPSNGVFTSTLQTTSVSWACSTATA